MAHTGLNLAQAFSTLRGLKMEHLLYVAYVESLEGFNFVDAKTGQKYLVTANALTKIYVGTRESEFIAESQIWQDCIEHGIVG